MDYFRSLLGQKPTPLAAFRNNPANRNESQRRRVLLNRQRAQRIINNNAAKASAAKVNAAKANAAKANAAQKAKLAIQVRAANAARQLSEQTRKVNPRFTPTLEAIAESNNNLPIPAAAPNGANQRARNAAEVALPENQNNIIKAQRKAARNEPNIWNMNEGRSFFQGPNVHPAITPVIASPAITPVIASPAITPVIASPAVSPAVSPAISQSGYPFGVVPSPSRKNKRLVSHNTTPGLARAQAANARKRHARLLLNVGSNQNKIMSNRGTTARLQQRLRDRGQTPVVNQIAQEKRQAAIAANPAVQARLAEKAAAAAPPNPNQRTAAARAANLAAFEAFGQPSPKGPEGGPIAVRQKPANNAPAANWLAYYRNQGIPNTNTRIQALLRERQRNEPAGNLGNFVAPGSAEAFLGSTEPVVALNSKIPGGLNARRPAGPPPGFVFPPTAARPAGLSPKAQAAIEQGLPNREPRRWNGANITANAQRRLNNNALRREKLRNSIKAMKASRSWNRAINLAGQQVRTSNNSVLNKEAVAAAKERVERYKLGVLPEQQALRKNAAANAAAAAAAAAAHEAAFAKSAEGPDVYGCTPCDRKILDKLDMLLDRSKPSTILGAIKGTGAFVVTQVGAALSDAEAALRMAIETGNKKLKKFAENALKYSQKKLEQLLKALTLSDETKEKIRIALSNIKDALVMLAEITGIVIGGSAAAAIVAALVPVAAAAAIIAGLALAGSSSLNYLITVAVPAATAAWSAAKAKILVGLGLAKNFMISTRKSLGKSLSNFGSGVGSRLSGLGSRLSTGTRGVRNYLSGRTKERARILRFIKYYAIQTGKKSINWNNLEETQMYNRWVRQLVETGMYESDAKLAIQNLLGGLSVNEVNGMVTAADGKAKVNPEAFVPPANLNYTRVKGVNAINANVEFELAKLRAQNARPGSAAERAYIQQTNQKERKRNAEYAKLNNEFLASSNFTAKRKVKLNAALAAYRQAKLNNQKALGNFVAAEAAAAAPVAAPAASSTGPSLLNRFAAAEAAAAAPVAAPAASSTGPSLLNRFAAAAKDYEVRRNARRGALASALAPPISAASAAAQDPRLAAAQQLGGKRSRKNRKSSRKNRKSSRKSSRKNRKSSRKN
jgi:hypothetical protein